MKLQVLGCAMRHYLVVPRSARNVFVMMFSSSAAALLVARKMQPPLGDAGQIVQPQ